MRFKYYFNNLSSRDKIFSFFLVPLILFFIFDFINTSFVQDSQNNIKQKIQVYTKSIKGLKQIKYTISDIKTIRYIEKLATTIGIKIINIKLDKSSFHIKTVGNYQNSIQFIINIENSMKIKSLQVSTNTNKQIVINSTFKMYGKNLNTQIQQVNNLPNPFNSKRVYTTNNKLTLIAIFNDDVCINDTWYKLGEKIGKYKLQKIFKNHIELSLNDKITKLHISDQDDK